MAKLSDERTTSGRTVVGHQADGNGRRGAPQDRACEAIPGPSPAVELGPDARPRRRGHNGLLMLRRRDEADGPRSADWRREGIGSQALKGAPSEFRLPGTHTPPQSPTVEDQRTRRPPSFFLPQRYASLRAGEGVVSAGSGAAAPGEPPTTTDRLGAPADVRAVWVEPTTHGLPTHRSGFPRTTRPRSPGADPRPLRR